MGEQQLVAGAVLQLGLGSSSFSSLPFPFFFFLLLSSSLSLLSLFSVFLNVEVCVRKWGGSGEMAGGCVVCVMSMTCEAMCGVYVTTQQITCYRCQPILTDSPP